ncbi:MFS transporter [Nocardioides campestrisoli]|uniref:MFS transporter n=1 Tax=Nocardioides campestrisoli TaxID=2736757 RepID=UPI0015E654FB|nr:MFS transporter [Nocardioides campestrisoli]
MSRADVLFARLVRTPGGRDTTGTLRPEVREHVGSNGLRQVAADALQNIGDQVVNAKTVLPWLLSAVGAPGVLLGLLVPIRESGSMLPQAALAPRVASRPVRRWIWVTGALGQAASVAAMALVALLTEGWVAGVGVLLALAVFSTSRALNSLAGKDVLGRTVPKGQRGQINGLVTVAAGLVAVTLGLALRVFGGDDVGLPVLVGLLAGAAVAWALAAVVFAGVVEPVEEPVDDAEDQGWFRSAVASLREDAGLRRFVLVRGLLLVSALSPPFVVALAVTEGGAGLAGLGPFVIAQGVAGLVGGRLFGRQADRSSRRLMVLGAALSSAVVLGFLALLLVDPMREWAYLYPVTYLLLAFVHTGVRVARKTYVVDMAGDDRRTEYVAVSNTAIGVLLLVAGALSGALATFGNEVALLFLAALGLLGVLVARTLPEVGIAADEPASPAARS